MKTSQVIISGCWCCVCFPFCLESLRRVEHSCPRFSFFCCFLNVIVLLQTSKFLLQVSVCLLLFVLCGRLTKCLSCRFKKTLPIFNVVCQVVDWLFFSIAEHFWSCCRCRKTLHIYNGGLWQWDSYEQWTDRRINQHRWFEVQSVKYTYNQKNLLFTNYRRAELPWHQQCTIG